MTSKNCRKWCWNYQKISEVIKIFENHCHPQILLVLAGHILFWGYKFKPYWKSPHIYFYIFTLLFKIISLFLCEKTSLIEMVESLFIYYAMIYSIIKILVLMWLIESKQIRGNLSETNREHTHRIHLPWHMTRVGNSELNKSWKQNVQKDYLHL